MIPAEERAEFFEEFGEEFSLEPYGIEPLDLEPRLFAVLGEPVPDQGSDLGFDG